jgi:DNA-binding NarL/FixJ family response regulator
VRILWVSDRSLIEKEDELAVTAAAALNDVAPFEAGGFANRRILVVDGHELICAGLRALLCRQPWVARCLGATEREAACALAFRYEPHVTLIDLLVGDDSGLEIGQAIRECCPTTTIVFMSSSGRMSAAAARAAGGHGFIPKDWNCAAILAAVRQATLGRPVFIPATSTVPRVRLSARERDVLRQLVLGATNIEAASRLNLSRHTIKQHTCAVYRKLGVRNRTEAVSRAHNLGLID